MTALANFPALLTPPLASALDDEARRFLTEMECDEPATWSPPRHLLDDPDLPGPDLADIDIGRLHQLVRQPLPLSVIAEMLNASLDAVRYLLALHPAPEHWCGPTSKPAPVLSGLTQRLSAAQLRDHYENQRLPLWEIAERYGANRNVVTRLARQSGIPLRPPQRPRQHQEVDHDWLYTEYVIKQRTLPISPPKKALSAMNMSRD